MEYNSLTISRQWNARDTCGHLFLTICVRFSYEHNIKDNKSLGKFLIRRINRSLEGLSCLVEHTCKLVDISSVHFVEEIVSLLCLVSTINSSVFGNDK